MAQIDSLTLDIQDDRVFLTFVAPGGAAASLDVEQLASRYEGKVHDVLLAWCRDRQSRATAERTNQLLAQDYTD